MWAFAYLKLSRTDSYGGHFQILHQSQMADRILKFIISHLGLCSNVKLGLVDFKVCDWPPETSLNGQSHTLKSCWPIKTCLGWLIGKLENPQDQVGHLSLGLNGRS